MDFNKKCNSSQDTIILSSVNEEEASKEQPHCKTNHSHKRKHSDATGTKKRYTTQQTNINCSEKHISQEIHVEKQEFQCIINLNTTVCGHKSKHRKKCDKKHRPKHSDTNVNLKKKYSIVPKCFRQVCANSAYYKSRSHQEVYGRSNAGSYERNKRICTKDEVKHKDQRKSKHVHHKHRNSRHENRQKDYKLFSYISSSPLKDDIGDNLTYEDISTTSLETYVEKPASYKRVKHHKHCNHVKQNKHKTEVQESKLDTLIKRTKERERKLVEQSRNAHKPWYTSTPIHNEFSSADFEMSCSDMDISLNSRSTLVLDTRNFAYSPSCPIEDLQQNSDTEKQSYGGYSPGSPARNKYYAMKISEDNDYKPVKIKNEPIMDIEVYSPIHSPDGSASCHLPAAPFKKEVKIKFEPMFSPGISPIHFETDNSGLQFCRIESIKSEIKNNT